MKTGFSRHSPDHRLGRDGRTGDAVHLVGIDFFPLLHCHDRRFDGQRLEVGQELVVGDDLVAQAGGLAAVQYLHSDDHPARRIVAINQFDRVLEPGPFTRHGVADERSVLTVARVDGLLVRQVAVR